MHKNICVSGFLFHLESQQILLHQPHQDSDSPILWSMFGGIGSQEKDAAVTFQQIIYDVLGIKLKSACIYPVYDYFHDVYNAMHHVYYAVVTNKQNYTLEGQTLSWFTFKQTLKLRFTPQTRQDIVVAQRVIEMQEREAQHTQYYRPDSS